MDSSKLTVAKYGESITGERKMEEANLDFRIQRAAKIFQDFDDSILNEKKTLEQYQHGFGLLVR